jgi:hypothetical protein
MRSAARVVAPNVFIRPRHRPATSVADSIVGGMFVAATGVAAPLAKLDAMLRPERTARARAALSQAHDGRTDGSAELRAIWFTRIAREGLRILLGLGFADAVLRRVEVTGGAGALSGNCVYAIYHTPWGRVLALWMARQSHGVLLSAQRWMERAEGAHVPCTWRGIRGLIDRVRRGRPAAVTADHFGPAGRRVTAASLLGRDVNVSTAVARIALAAGVPIVPVMTRYRAGKLRVVVCAAIPVDRSDVESATRRMTSVFDAELRRDPSAWEQAHRFLSSAVPTDSQTLPAPGPG